MNLQEKYLHWAFFLDLFGVFGKIHSSLSSSVQKLVMPRKDITNQLQMQPGGEDESGDGQKDLAIPVSYFHGTKRILQRPSRR